MLRYFFLKLPGLTCISDGPVSSPCSHVRMLRSLSPVKHDSRKDNSRNAPERNSYKRSYSFPSSRIKMIDMSETHKLKHGNDLQVIQRDQNLQKRGYCQKNKKLTKKRNEHVEIEKCKEISAQREVDKELLAAEEDLEEKLFDDVAEQYELEAAKPRRSRSELAFNVFELIERKEHDPVGHLQPNNLKPFGSIENVYNPAVMKSKSSSFSRFPPGYDDVEQLKSDRKIKRAEGIQHREYSTSSRVFRPEVHVELIQNLPPMTFSERHARKRDLNENHSHITDNCTNKLDEFNSESLCNQAEINSCEPQNSPCTGRSVEIDFPQNEIENMNDLSLMKEPGNITETLQRLETPWPSYSDTLKNHANDNEEVLSVEEVLENTEPNSSSIKTDSSQRYTSNTSKVQRSVNYKDGKLVNRSNILRNVTGVPQRRTLSTEPVLTKNKENKNNRNQLKGTRSVASKSIPSKASPPEKSRINPRPYSKKSRPLEPESCEKEPPPNKCFLPSKIRLKPPECTPKPELCRVEEPCVRADDNLKIEPKRLPHIPASNCQCVETEIPEINPRLKRLKMKFQDPPRECPCDPCPCPPRADDNLQEKPKKLSPLKPKECLCIEPPPMVDVPLRRLKKNCVPDEKCYPKPECPKEEPCVRADDDLRDCKKMLPQLKASSCPCIEPEVPDRSPKMKRLKFVFKDPPRSCPCDPDCPCPPRADNDLIEKTKKLPLLKPGECACIETPAMIDVPLKRLQKVCIPEEKCYPKERECPVPEPCVRADDCLKLDVKPLPTLKPSNCTCTESFIPDKMPKMRRLEMAFKDEPRECPCDSECPCPPRADDGLQPKIKKLPQIVSGECECVEPPPLIDVPLKRLQKICVPEEKCYPLKAECPQPETCTRADDDLCVERKELPVIEAKFCPCVEEQPMKEAPALKRLHIKAPDPPKVCPKESCVCEVDCPRADDHLMEKIKPLPILKVKECPCTEQPMIDARPLKRLKCKEVQEECLTVDPCISYPRADMGCWEYWSPEEDKCKDKKTQKKKGVNVNTRRKYNTDSRVKLFYYVKNATDRNDSSRQYSIESKEPKIDDAKSASVAGEFNKVSGAWKEKVGWVAKKPDADNKPKFPINRYASLTSISTPTVSLLKQLKDLEKGCHKKIAFEITNERKHDMKNINSLPFSNVRNLSTNVQALRPDSVRQISTDKNKPSTDKTNKTMKTKLSPCQNKCKVAPHRDCMSDKCDKSCKKDRTPVCCDKKSSPYPSFSEVMEEEVEPFSENTQWTCNRQEFGFHPRYKKLNNPFNDDKNKRSYTTTTSENIATNRLKQGRSDIIDLKKAIRFEGNERNILIPSNQSVGYTKIEGNSGNLAGVPYSKLAVQKSKFGAIRFDNGSSKILKLNRNLLLSSQLPNWTQSQPSLRMVRRISSKICYSTHSKKEKMQKCDKKKKKCPKFKLEHCPPPEIRSTCKPKKKQIFCDKSQAPYPAFTDCLEGELSENLSECPLEIEKIKELQPKFIQPLDKPKLVKPVAPVVGKLDLKKEDTCVREKLCMENKGLSQNCDEFGKLQKPMRAKDHLKKERSPDCIKIDELKKLQKWPPKNSRGLCTSSNVFLVYQTRGVCRLAKTHLLEELEEKNTNDVKEYSRNIAKSAPQASVKVRNYHILCMKPEKKLNNDIDENINEVSHHVLTEDDACRFKKLRNVQWRINNFQKWHRLNKLSNLPGYVKRFYCNMDKKEEYVSVGQSQQFSTSATHSLSFSETMDVPLYRGISTNFILAQTKKSSIGYIQMKKGKKCPKQSKSCPKFTYQDCPSQTRLECSEKKPSKKYGKKQEAPHNSFSDYKFIESKSKISECPGEREKFKRLQPHYPILPEVEKPFFDSTFHEKLDRTLDEEYAREKYGIEKEGLTQYCHNFGEKNKQIRPSEIKNDDFQIPQENFAISRAETTNSVIVPEYHSTKIAEVPNVHFSSSIEGKTIGRVSFSNIHTNKSGSGECEDPQENTTSPKSKAIKICQELSVELTVPTSYKTCPEPPQNSKITQHCAEEKSTGKDEQCRESKRRSSCSSLESKSPELTIWQKIANYFKARPNCPAPDEWKKKAARKKAEKYAKAAGLILLDPKELPKDFPSKKGKCSTEELPRVITDHNCFSNKKKKQGQGRKSYSTTAIIQQDKSSELAQIGNNSDIVNFPTGRYVKCFHPKTVEFDAKKYTKSEIVVNLSAKHMSDEGGEFSKMSTELDEIGSLQDLALCKEVGHTSVFLSTPVESEICSNVIAENNTPSNDHDDMDRLLETTSKHIHDDEWIDRYRIGEDSYWIRKPKCNQTLYYRGNSTDIKRIKSESTKQIIDIQSNCECSGLARSSRPNQSESDFSSEYSEWKNCDSTIKNSDLSREMNSCDNSTSLVSEETNMSSKYPKVAKGSRMLNTCSPFVTIMRRYYSKNASWNNIEEINKTLENEDEKRLHKKISTFQEANILKDDEIDDEFLDERASYRPNSDAENEIVDHPQKIWSRKPSFFDIMFNEPLHGNFGYNQAKTFASFQECFHKIEVSSDVNYEDIERIRTSNLIKELDKLIDDDKKGKDKN